MVSPLEGEMSQQYLIVVIAACAAIFGLVIYSRYWYLKKRTEALQSVAQEMRLSFTPEGDEVLMSALAGFHLFSRGHSKKIRNLMRGVIKDREVKVFDYSYTIGHGKERHTRRQTVACFEVPSRLPGFSLQPERLWHKLEEWLGRKDMNFDAHPDFSKKYLLRGADEIAIRRLFDTRALEFFEGHPGLCVEGDGNILIFYRGSSQVKPGAIRPFIDEGVSVLGAFRDALG